MDYEYNFYEMTDKQLMQKYKWNTSEIQYAKSKINSQKLLDNICFWIDLLIGTSLGIGTIYILFHELIVIANILGICYIALHGYCCIGFKIYSEDFIKNLENRIVELEDENIIIKERLEAINIEN